MIAVPFSPKLMLVGMTIASVGVFPHPAPKHVSQAASEPAKPIVKQLKAEDYYIPLDNWLKSKGSPLSGKDFYEVGGEYRVDPDLLIAITQAETNLGTVKQRGSDCNVGSVGSYDSTNTTYSCQGYRHGIEQIAQTLTNKQLGGYVRVSELSRAHNKTGPIYASSEVNWHRNVTDTMRELKGSNQEDFFIRK